MGLRIGPAGAFIEPRVCLFLRQSPPSVAVDAGRIRQVPLSEHEQRLLEQMERALHAEDPKFASALQGADLRALFRRRAFLAVAGFVIGLGMLVAGVVIALIALSVGGFVVMLGCAWLAYASWRRI